MEDKSTFSFETAKINFADDKIPIFKEKRGSDFIQYGENNDFPNLLAEMYDRCAIHNAIVTRKAMYLQGEGYTIEGGSTAEQAKVQEFLNNINPFDGYEEVIFKLACDFEIYDGFAIEIIWNKTGTKIAEMYHKPFGNLRVNKEFTKCYYAEQWTWDTKKKDIQELPLFNPLQAINEPKQIFYFRNYRAGTKYYPKPTYIGALQAIRTAVEIMNFHYNNLMNGFSNGTIIQFFKGIPTPEEARIAERQFKKHGTGTDNAGGIRLQWNDKNEQASTIDRIEPDKLHEQFMQLSKDVEQQILTGHNVTSPMLFGIKTEGQLGGRAETLEAWEIFKSTYLNPRQKTLFAQFNYLLSFVVKGVKVKPNVSAPIDVDYMALFAAQVIDKNEIREKYGFKVIEEEAEVTEPIEPTPEQIEAEQAKKWDNKKDIKLFARYGKKVDELLDLEEIEFTQALVALAELSENETKIIRVISATPIIDIADISEITKIDPKEVQSTLETLKESGKISIGEQGYKITQVGKKAIADSGGIQTEIFVMYQYAKNPDAAGDTLLPTSRDFCREMIGLNRVYTREEIDEMSDILGYNVWKRRGGWYYNPSKDVTTPYCRHIWMQRLFRRRVQQ